MLGFFPPFENLKSTYIVSVREACINFMDLCKRKNEDRLWMAELAAMQACSRLDLSYLETSGILLDGEDNDPSQNLMMNFSSGKQNGLADASDAGSGDINRGKDGCQISSSSNDDLYSSAMTSYNC